MKSNLSLDIEFVRGQFPGLDNGWALFDNAGGSQALVGVVSKISDYLYNKNVQIGGTYETSLKAAKALYDGRKAMKYLINASRPDEIVFASSSTVALQHLAKSMASQLSENDEIIVTNSDHESNIGPWLRLEERGVKIKIWELNKETIEHDLDDLKELFTKKTKLVCVTHVSNILGTINPIADISKFVHAQGARICVDSVAFAPHRCIDVKMLDVDYLVFSTYKAYGPHFAVLYGKYDYLRELDNLYHYFYDKEKIPAKLEPGNPNYELAYSLTGIVDYLCRIGEQAGVQGDVREKIVAAFDVITAHENSIAEKLLKYLRDRSDCHIIGKKSGNDPERVPTISFIIEGKDPGKLARLLEKYKIAVRFGDFHARRLVEYLGLLEQNGVLRVSMAHYNTLEEVDALINALEETIG